MREVVESSSLRSIGYDRVTRVLEIEFRGGRTYRYRDVPPELVGELKRAASKGQFFQSFVRDRFETTRVS